MLEIAASVADNLRNVISRSQLSFISVVAICLAAPNSVRAQAVTKAEYLTAVNDMIAELAPRSAQAAAAIRDTYRPFAPLLTLADFDQIEQGLATGGLVPLPLDVTRFNVRVRLEGTSPVGEQDIVHQGRYVSARPAAIGCLLDIASRVKSGPVEVTSLVRHIGYQDQLRLLNPNATTDVPTHAFGVAFDIAMVNTPLKTVLEIRDVLEEMSGAGDILAIAERQQLIFHVVPQPARLGWYNDVYARAITGRTWGPPSDGGAVLTPMVTAAVGSVLPMPDASAEWWAAENVPIEAPMFVLVEAPAPAVQPDPPAPSTPIYVAILGEILSSTWHRMLPWNIG